MVQCLTSCSLWYRPNHINIHCTFQSGWRSCSVASLPFSTIWTLQIPGQKVQQLPMQLPPTASPFCSTRSPCSGKLTLLLCVCKCRFCFVPKAALRLRQLRQAVFCAVCSQSGDYRQTGSHTYANVMGFVCFSVTMTCCKVHFLLTIKIAPYLL